MTYEELVHKIITKEKLDFSRFGDGEMAAVLQTRKKKGAVNADGHEFFPDMGERLLEILKRSPSYYIGLQNLAYRQRPETIDALTKKYHLNWCKSDILHYANINGRLGVFMEALKDRDVLLVGPKHLYPLVKKEGWYTVPVPDKNAWLEYDTIHENIKALLPLKEWVVLYCCGMSAGIYIDDFQGLATQIDCGSIFDPYVGVHSRSYHKTLNLE